MYAGRVVEVADVRGRWCAEPRHPYTQGAAGRRPRARPREPAAAARRRGRRAAQSPATCPAAVPSGPAVRWPSPASARWTDPPLVAARRRRPGRLPPRARRGRGARRRSGDTMAVADRRRAGSEAAWPSASEPRPSAPPGQHLHRVVLARREGGGQARLDGRGRGSPGQVRELARIAGRRPPATSSTGRRTGRRAPSRRSRTRCTTHRPMPASSVVRTPMPRRHLGARCRSCECSSKTTSRPTVVPPLAQDAPAGCPSPSTPWPFGNGPITQPAIAHRVGARSTLVRVVVTVRGAVPSTAGQRMNSGRASRRGRTWRPAVRAPGHPVVRGEDHQRLGTALGRELRPARPRASGRRRAASRSGSSAAARWAPLAQSWRYAGLSEQVRSRDRGVVHAAMSAHAAAPRSRGSGTDAVSDSTPCSSRPPWTANGASQRNRARRDPRIAEAGERTAPDLASCCSRLGRRPNRLLPAVHQAG